MHPPTTIRYLYRFLKKQSLGKTGWLCVSVCVFTCCEEENGFVLMVHFLRIEVKV